MKPIYFRFMLQCLCSIGVSISIISCGGDNNTSSSPQASSKNVDHESVVLAANSLSVTVAAGLGGGPNMPYVSVTICEPGTKNCKTIHNIQIDTGSSGLRIFASAVKSLNLGSTAPTIYDCTTFGDNVTWGTIKFADIRMAAEIASSMPIQVIEDSPGFEVPSSCSNGLPAQQTPTALEANGIIGVSINTYDIGASFFDCIPSTASSCAISLPPNFQIQNPIASFAVNNNGLLIQLPSLGPLGSPSASGAVIFGIDTQSNNSSNGANLIPTNSNGQFTTIFNNIVYPLSFIDSGSNMLYFPQGSKSNELPICQNSGYYCPITTQSYSATMALKNNAASSIIFSVANANILGATNNYAFANLAGPLVGLSANTQTFDWGLPFFFGRSVYVGIAGKTSNAGTGPYFAYTDN